MPSGRTHDCITIFSIIPITLLGMYFLRYNTFEIIIFLLAAIFSQLMFGPDLDAKSTQYKRWGIFKWIWLPYRKIFKHRSKFSHGLFWGPVMRCAYLLICLIIISIITSYFLNYYFQINLIYLILPVLNNFFLNADKSIILPLLFASMTGIFLGAAIHTMTDKTVSFFKNLF